MTTGKMLEVVARYEAGVGADPAWERLPAGRCTKIAIMLPQMRQFVLDDRREKFMRWLGFVQGVLWDHGVYTLDELKAHNAPDEPEGA